MEQGNVRIDYLTWVKELFRKSTEFEIFYNMVGSSMDEPMELLEKHIPMALSKQALEHPDPWFHPKLIENISRIEGVSPDRVLITNGASGGIFLVCKTLLDPGDHVIIEYPCYEPLHAIPKYLGARITWLLRRHQTGYDIDLKECASLMTPQTKLVILTNLHNPSGALLTDNALSDILTTAREINPHARILVDEVYHRFVDTPVKPAAHLDKHVISINSLSKVFGLHVLRCGWIVADPDFIQNVMHLFVLLENIGSPLNEAIASVVLDHHEEYESRSKQLLLRNRAILNEAIQPLLEKGYLKGRIPEYGCICFPELVGVPDADVFLRDLAEKQHVYAVPGRFFGTPQHVRIGFGGGTEELEIALKKFSHQIIQSNS